MISQVALSLVHSPVHSHDSYISVAEKAVEYGCDEICLKDMSGTVSPSLIAQLTTSLKKRFPHIPVHYHGHCGPNDTMVSIFEAAMAGVDSVDVAIEPLAWGKGHPDVAAVRKMLVENGFLVKDIDMEAYRGLSSLLTRQLSENMRYPDDTDARRLLAGSILPGGMIGSMISEMREIRELVSMEDVLAEIEYVWPRLGYPPLVTPFSQYVRNIALMNVLNLAKGKPRWKSIDKDSWNMILGRMGRLPGQVCPEMTALAKEKGYEFYNGDPSELYPNELVRFKGMMPDEELLEFAMHDRRYRTALLESERSGSGNDLEPSGEVVDL
jgi:pyruvate carboxylase subunit B